MNEDANAITVAAAAAIAMLAAPHPVVAYTQPLIQTRDPATTSSYILLSSIASVVNHLNTPPPRPEQGGQRITLHWLHSLSDESYSWHFRLVYFNLENSDRELMTRVAQIHS
jgi:hypothetical protein